MENASKALIMAGEILIALLIIGLLVYGFASIRNLSETEANSKEIEQLAKFNKVYESYNRKLLRGVDVISLINRAIDNNKKYEYSGQYNITIKFHLKYDLEAYVKHKVKDEATGLMVDEVRHDRKGSLSANKQPDEYYTITTPDDDAYKKVLNDKKDTEIFNDFKRRIFDCKDVKYNNLGRVSEITFIEREQDLTQGVIE